MSQCEAESAPHPHSPTHQCFELYVYRRKPKEKGKVGEIYQTKGLKHEDEENVRVEIEREKGVGVVSVGDGERKDAHSERMETCVREDGDK